MRLLVILCKTEAEAQQALELLRAEITRRKQRSIPKRREFRMPHNPVGSIFQGIILKEATSGPGSIALPGFKDKIRRHTRRSMGPNASA